MKAGKQDHLERLTTIEGHIHRLRQMINEDQYCVDILRHMHGIRKEMEQLDAMILETHLYTCVPTGLRAGETERVITELLQLYHLAGNR